VLTVGELCKGIELLPAGAKQKDLQRWLSDLESEFGDRILSIDVETTTLWGHLTARLQKAGVILPSVDGLIAATALRNGMKLVTRNARHFKETGAIIVDPWV
jgi:predicted nucleic acid-binding protein